MAVVEVVSSIQHLGRGFSQAGREALGQKKRPWAKKKKEALGCLMQKQTDRDLLQ